MTDASSMRNIFYYHYVEAPPFSEPCTTFLERAAAGDIEIYTSLHVLAEAIHKVMIAEAEQTFGRSRAGLVNWLRHDQGRIAELDAFRQAAADLAATGLRLLPADLTDLIEASRLSARLGLLTNDAMVLALMGRHSLTNLVTNDDDFDGHPGLSIWKPR